MAKLLGLSAFHRDAAAAVVVDGRVVASVQEDRFTKRLQDESFPIRAARACLEEARLQMGDLDGVVFYEKPLRKFERVLATQLGAFPKSARSFSRNMFLWLGDRLWMKNRIADELEWSDTSRIYFTEHQLAHAASAFLPSPFDEAAVLTLDDVGEWATTTLCRGSGNDLELLSEVRFPDSLGMLVSAVAQYLGLEPGAQDALLEALAPHGAPRFLDELRALVPATEDGAFTVDQSAFRYVFDHATLYAKGLEERLGPARLATSPLRFEGADRRDADVSASLQALLEERALQLCAALHERTGLPSLCFAGILAENRTLCARLLKDGPFERLYVPPCPDDAGAALGAALYVHAALEPETPIAPLADAFLGMPIERRPEEGAVTLDDVHDALLSLLVGGERVAWVRGRLELGARSLGHRSLLADPRPGDARGRLHEAVQHAEPYLPIRVAMPAERAIDYIDLPPGGEHPLRLGQLFVPASAELRERAPSAVRPDGTAWPQLVHADEDPALHRLLTAFGERTGAPLLLHETFALRGSPIVRIESDAHDAFLRSGLDALVVEDRLYARASLHA